MRTLINLETTVFDPRTIPTLLPEATIRTFHKGRQQFLPNFGTVLIGWNRVRSPEACSEIERLIFGTNSPAERPEPLFSAPETWRWPQLLKALGVFPSSTSAAKNGWNKDIDPGLSCAVVRLAKVRGEISVLRINPTSPWVLDFLSSSTILVQKIVEVR